MDIKIKTDEWNLHCRTCGVIEQDGKYLIMRVNKTPHFHIPGGHIEIGEDSATAICREIKEETGFDITIANLFCVNENFYAFKGKKVHGIEFYYMVNPLNKVSQSNSTREENDKGEIKELEFKWVTKTELEDINLQPQNIKELILNGKTNQFNHLIINEL